MTTTQTTIAALNDQFRVHGPSASVPGRMFITAGVAALPCPVLAATLASVRAFDTFTEDNDPYGEHEFGAVDIEGAGRIFWKIDYYADADLEAGSEDPGDVSRCFRVLTVMLASEY